MQYQLTMMNLQVQVAASLCLVLLVIQPALNEPIKSYKGLSYDESENERVHANIRIVERETIKKTPTCDCHSKITKLPAVTIHQDGVRTFHQPTDSDLDDVSTPHRYADDDSDVIGEQDLLLRKINEKYGKAVINSRLARLQQARESDDDEEFLPAQLRHFNQKDEKVNREELLLRRLYEKYGDNLPALNPQPRPPVINRRLARLQHARESDIDIDEFVLAHQNDQKLSNEELSLRKLCEKYGDSLPACGPKQPIINRRLARLQQARQSYNDDEESIPFKSYW